MPLFHELAVDFYDMSCWAPRSSHGTPEGGEGRLAATKSMLNFDLPDLPAQRAPAKPAKRLQHRANTRKRETVCKTVLLSGRRNVASSSRAQLAWAAAMCMLSMNMIESC